MHELDRILDRDDVRAAAFVDVVYHGGERGTLAGTGHAGDQHETARLERELLENRRQIQIADRRGGMGDGAHRKGHRPFLLVHVHAETPDARHVDGEV